LATITPAAGYVTVTSAVIIGFTSGIVCYLAVAWKNRQGWDDALDVWGVHGVGGFLGTIMLGIFGTAAVNIKGLAVWPVGLLEGGTSFFLKQSVTAIGTAAYAIGFTLLMLWLINKIVPVRVTEEEQRLGLDEALHGEAAYESEML